MYCRHALWRIVGIVAGSLLRQCVRSSSNAQLQAVSVCNACLCRLFQLAMHACAGCFSLQCMFLQLLFGPILRSHHFPPCRGGRQIGGSSHGRLIQLAAVGGGPAGGSGRSPQPHASATTHEPWQEQDQLCTLGSRWRLLLLLLPPPMGLRWLQQEQQQKIGDA